jgi:predicted TPR repeat methyltransferase
MLATTDQDPAVRAAVYEEASDIAARWQQMAARNSSQRGPLSEARAAAVAFGTALEVHP